MFDQISPTYDRTNRVLSLGLDLRWRKKVARYLPARPHCHVLDLATGTADQLIALFEAGASIQSAVGVDLAEEMLELGRKKVGKKPYRERVELLEGNAERLSFLPNSFDAVTCSFGIRNVSNVPSALKEVHRVLRPLGRVLILEFSLPKRPVLWGYLLYLRHILPWVGGRLSKNPEAYRYLNQTIETFPSGRDFCLKMEQAGFKQVKAHPMALGAVTLYVGEKDLLA